jgi:hypothetical protein
MLELTLLTLLNRLMSWGRAPVIATRAIVADAATLLALVTDPAGQWRIVDGVSPRLRPHAHVEPSHSARLVKVRVQCGHRDVLWVTWMLTPRRGTTEVDLAAQLESRSVLARLVLLAGGRRWLRHRVEQTLSCLAALAHGAAEDIADIERDAEIPARPPAATGTCPPARKNPARGDAHADHEHHEHTAGLRHRAPHRRRAAARRSLRHRPSGRRARRA